MSVLVRSASLTGFPELGRAVGLDPCQLLTAVNLPLACLDTPDMMIPARAVGRLLELAAIASRTENFGLRLAASRRLSNLGAVALVAREEPTVGKAIEAVARYQRLLNGAAELRIERNEGAAIIATVSIGRRPSPARQGTELTIGVLFGLVQTLLGGAWRPRRVCFMHEAPRDVSLHRRLFGLLPTFGHTFNGFICDETDLDRARPGSDTALTRAVRVHLDELLARRGASFHDEVREAIAQRLTAGDCSLDRVAAQIGMVPRTLQRRLRKAGHGFFALEDEIRGNLACQYMTNLDMRMTTVAMLVGFSELSAFSRWFKTKFGYSPSAYIRDRHGVR